MPPSFIPFGARTLLVGDIQLTHSTPVARNPKPGKAWYVDPQGGSDTSSPNTGRSWAAAKASMDGVFDESTFDDGDTIYLTGVLREYASTPTHPTTTTRYVHDVSIIGVGNVPRQALTGTTHNGAGATWMSPTTVVNASALLKIRGQGWHIENIYFNNAGTGAPAIDIYRDAETVEADASHTRVVGCKFIGTDDGILATGGPNFVQIRNNEFFNFTGSGDTAINYLTGAGVGTHLMWQITGNVFVNNVNHIVVPCRSSFISGNHFGHVGLDVTTTKHVDLTNGTRNTVMGNFFEVAHAETGSAAMFLPQSTANSWYNFYRDGDVALVPATA